MINSKAGDSVPQVVLDLDLDFFLDDVWQPGTSGQRARATPRLQSGQYEPWAGTDVRDFLETKCGLSKSKPTPGGFFESHDELFFRLRDWVRSGTLTPPFHLAHVDAHADLGAGDRMVLGYLMGEHLERPVERRSDPPRDKLNEANWLAFALACRWIKTVEYVPNAQTAFDLPGYLVKLAPKKGHPLNDLRVKREGWIRMWGYDPKERDEEDYCVIEYLSRRSAEPPVRIQVTPAHQFRLSDPCSLVCLTRSPQYTPAESDRLIPLILEYIELRKPTHL